LRSLLANREAPPFASELNEVHISSYCNNLDSRGYKMSPKQYRFYQKARFSNNDLNDEEAKESNIHEL